MFSDRRNDDLMDVSGKANWTSPRRQYAHFGIGPSPIAQAGEQAFATPVLLHPDKSSCLVSEPPRLNDLDRAGPLGHVSPKHQHAIIGSKQLHRKAFDVI